MFDHTDFHGHEGVHTFYDDATGLKAVIAIHSTALGPAAGGTRMWNYASSDDVISDVLRLSEGMSYKNAIADIPFGGGKGVIWGNPRQDKSPELFRAYGRAVDSLNGRYYTAEDVGISVADMEEVRTETKYVAGLNSGAAASGDPSPVTAKGVFLGIKEVSKRVFGDANLNDRVIAVQGLGSVGRAVCGNLAEAGATLLVADINEEVLTETAAATGAKIIPPDEIYSVEADIFSPNALGAIINADTIDQLNVKAVAGSANNQLADEQFGLELKRRGILYAPDYVINGGGIINVVAEISGEYSKDWVDMKLAKLIDTLGDILDTGLSGEASTSQIADQMARDKIEAAKSTA